MRMKKMLSLCLILCFGMTLPFSVSASFENFTTAELTGAPMSWGSESSSIHLKESVWRIRISNDLSSSTDMSYAVYNVNDRENPIKSGQVAPGKTHNEWFILDKTQEGSYFVTLSCVIPPNIFFTMPPCKGTAQLGWW